MTLLGLSRERSARFSPRTDRDWRLMSIKTADWAPRLKASRPRAPVPANRSNTRASRTSNAIILKIASRVRPEVGLVLVPRTVRSFLPLNFPPIIRNTVSFSDERSESEKQQPCDANERSEWAVKKIPSEQAQLNLC